MSYKTGITASLFAICTKVLDPLFEKSYTGFLRPRTPTMMMSSTMAGKQLQKAKIHLKKEWFNTHLQYIEERCPKFREIFKNEDT